MQELTQNRVKYAQAKKEFDIFCIKTLTFVHLK